MHIRKWKYTYMAGHIGFSHGIHKSYTFMSHEPFLIAITQARYFLYVLCTKMKYGKLNIRIQYTYVLHTYLHCPLYVVSHLLFALSNLWEDSHGLILLSSTNRHYTRVAVLSKSTYKKDLHINTYICGPCI